MPFSRVLNRPLLLAGTGLVAVIVAALVYLTLASILGLPPFTPEPAFQSNIQIVLDRSIAMEEPFGDGTKMEAAVRAIDNRILAREVAGSSNLAFRQFGGPCTGENSQLLVEFGREHQQDVRSALRDINVAGETTFVDGIIQAVRDFGQADGRQATHNEIIVIAGGGDTCRLEEAAPRIRQEIERLGVPVNIRFIGLDVPEDQRAALDAAARAISGELPIYVNSPIELDEKLTQLMASVEDTAEKSRAGDINLAAGPQLPPIPPTVTPIPTPDGDDSEDDGPQRLLVEEPPAEEPPAEEPPAEEPPAEEPPAEEPPAEEPPVEEPPAEEPPAEEPPAEEPPEEEPPAEEPPEEESPSGGSPTDDDDDGDRRLTTLTVVKSVTNDNGGTAQIGDFILRIDGNQVASGSPVVVNPGTHTVSEDQRDGYGPPTFGGACTSLGEVTVANGASLTCTITNDDVAPTLTVVKQVIDNIRDEGFPSQFTISITGSGATPSTFQGNPEGTEVTLNVGPYTVGETPTQGYVQLFSAGCSGTLGLDESATCTITNEYIGIADLELSKTVSDASPNGGDRITYTLTLSNNGPDAASGIEVTDPLPAGVTFVSATPSAGNYDNDSDVWSVDGLEADASATLTIDGTVDLDTCGNTFTNTAAVSAIDQDDPDILNNSDSVEITVECADLALTKSAVPDPVEVGSPLTYTITVTNNGPSDATGVTLTDTLDILPANVTFGSATVTPEGDCSEEAGTVTCNIGGLSSGDSATVEIVVTPEAEEAIDDFESSESGAIDLERAPTSVIPGDLENDFFIRLFSERQFLALPADVNLNVSSPGDYGTAGDLTTEVIPAGTVVNSFMLHFDTESGSPVSAEGTVTFNADILGLVLVDSDLDNADGIIGAADTAYPTDTGQRGLEVAPDGDAVTVSQDRRTLTVLLAEGGGGIDQLRVITAASLTNSAQVTGSQTDQDPDNNTDTVVTNITGEADLFVSKTVDNSTPNVGDVITYTVTVFNIGPSAATGVELRDQLPADLTLDSFSASRGTYDEASGIWTLGDLSSSFSSFEFSDRATLTISARVNMGAAGTTVTNTAEVTALDQVDPDSEDDQDSVTITVEDIPPLQIDPTSVAVVSGDTQNFAASGGAPPYTFSIAENNSGGSIDQNGLYTAGPSSGVTDTVRVTDAEGNFADATVTAIAPLQISPTSATVVSGDTQNFDASGGVTPYTFSLAVNNSGGSIDQGTGLYTAGPTSGVTDTVRATDAEGNTDEAVVTVSPREPATINTVDNEGDVGEDTAIAIGSDGFPVISYYDATNGDLKVAHCRDSLCDTANITTVDGEGDVGEFTSITLNDQGLPVISYYDATNGDLKVAHCQDAGCVSVATTTMINVGDVGRHNSIVDGPTSGPSISYYDATNRELRVVECISDACESSIVTVLDTDIEAQDTSIAIWEDPPGSGPTRNPVFGPVVSYYDAASRDLMVADCRESCSSLGGADNTVIRVDSDGDVGRYTSIAIDPVGLPIISYYDATNGDLKVAHCEDVSIACQSAAINTVDSMGDVGLSTSIAIGADGLPLISYYDATNGDLKVAHCDDLDCSSATINTLDRAGDVGLGTSLVGLVISYYDRTNGDLKAARCHNTACTPE